MQDNSTQSSSTEVATVKVDTDTNIPTHTNVSKNVSVKETKKGGTGKCLLIGCVVLILCCVVTFGGIFALFKFGGAAVLSSQTEPDATLTRLTSITQVEQEFETLEIKTEFLPENPSQEMTSIALSEKQLLAVLFKNFNVKENLNAFGVDMEPDRIKLEANLGVIYANFEPNEQAASFQGLDEMYVSVDISVIASGKEFLVNKVSLGNSILDSLLGDTIATSVETFLNEGFIGNSESDIDIERIDILKDKLVMLVSTTSPAVTGIEENIDETNLNLDFTK